MKPLQFAKIRQKGLRVTRQRRTILSVLEKTAQPVSAQQICAAVAGQGVNRSSVFRSLKTFAERGVVEVAENAHHEHLYELRRSLPHHHLVCERCGRTETVKCFLPPRMLRSWEKRYGFHAVRHESSAYGLCRACHDR